MLHTLEEYRWFIANVILKECEVTVAEDENGIVAFLARKGEEVRLLYTRHDRIGMGAGTQLIDAAKPAGSPHSNCGASRRMSVHDVFTKHEAFVRSDFPMVRTTRSGCPTSAIGGNLWRRAASSTRKNSGAGARGRHKILREFRSSRQLHGCQREFSPPLIAIDGLPSSLRTSCLEVRRCRASR